MLAKESSVFVMHINFNFTLNLFGMIQSIIDPTVEPTMCKSTPTFDLMSSKTSYELYANIEGDDDFEMPGINLPFSNFIPF